MEFVTSRMLGVMMLPAVWDVVAEGSVDGLEVRYVHRSRLSRSTDPTRRDDSRGARRQSQR